MYTQLKILHVTTVALSGAGFVVRGVALRRNAGWARGRAARTLPHVIDAVLLATGIALALALGVTPGNSPWLAAKLAGVLLYICLGMVALKFLPHARLGRLAWLAALVTFAWIASVAMTRDPLGIARLL